MRDEIRRVACDDPILDGVRNAETDMSSDIWVGLWDGEPVIVWGIIPRCLLSEDAFVWSFTWPAVHKCKKTFLRRTREMVKELHKTYPTLYGLCSRHTRWLDHLGAVYTSTFDNYHVFVIRHV